MMAPDTRSSATDSRTLSILECPDCRRGTELATELVDGALVYCQHCGSELMVVRECIDETVRYRLMPQDPYEDEFIEDGD